MSSLKNYRRKKKDKGGIDRGRLIEPDQISPIKTKLFQQECLVCLWVFISENIDLPLGD